MQVWIDDAGRDVAPGTLTRQLTRRWHYHLPESAAIRRAWAAATPVTTRRISLPLFVGCLAFSLYVTYFASRLGHKEALLPPLMTVLGISLVLWRYYRGWVPDVPSDAWLRKWKQSMLASRRCPACSYTLDHCPGDEQVTCAECGHAWAWTPDDSVPLQRSDFRAAYRFGRWCRSLLRR